MNDLTVVVGKENEWYDYSDLIKKLTFSGRKGAAPRTVQIVFQDSECYGHSRTNLSCEDGKICAVYFKGEEIFRGLIMSDAAGKRRQLNITAYDNCIYLSNNKDSFSYKEKRADEIFSDCLARLNLEVGEIVNTEHIIPELIKPATSFWDVIEDALSQTYAVNGKRYYVSSDKGKISLKRRLEQKSISVLEVDANIENYDRTRSITNTRTRLKLSTSEGEVKKTFINSELEEKIGMFQDVDSVEEDITETELQQRVDTFRKEKALVQQELKVTCLGNIAIRSGSCVYVQIPQIQERRVMYVDEDTHTFEKGSHKMILKLNYAGDIDSAG